MVGADKNTTKTVRRRRVTKEMREMQEKEVKKEVVETQSLFEVDERKIVQLGATRLNRSVPTRVARGTVRAVINTLDDYEEGFAFAPIEQPEIPGMYALFNASPMLGNDKYFFSIVSNRYRLIKTGKTLNDIAEALQAIYPSIHDHEALAVYGTSSHVRVSDNNGNPLLMLVNSYDRTAREQIIFPQAMVALKYTHTQSGVAKQDLKKILEALTNTELHEKWQDGLRTTEVTKKEILGFLTSIGRRPQAVLTKFFGYQPEGKLEADEWVEVFWKHYSVNYGLQLSGFVGFVNRLYREYVSNAESGKVGSDHVAKLLDRAASFVGRKLGKVW